MVATARLPEGAEISKNHYLQMDKTRPSFYLLRDKLVMGEMVVLMTVGMEVVFLTTVGLLSSSRSWSLSMAWRLLWMLLLAFSDHRAAMASAELRAAVMELR